MSDLLDQYVATQRHGHEIGPSGLHSCIRQKAYEYLGCEPTDEVDKSAADFGTLVHLGYSAMIRAMHDPADRDADVVIDWGGPRIGSADDVNYRDRIVTDLKVPGGKSYHWQVNNEPKREYVDQLMVYAHGLQMKHGGTWTCRLYLINREDPSQRHTFEFPHDPALSQVLIDEANAKHDALAASASLAGMTASAAERYELAETYPREGKGRGSYPCDFCAFEGRCLPQPDNPDQNAMSAEIEGNDPVILEHATKYLEARGEVNNWTQVADAHRAHLAGLDGTYRDGDLAVRISTVGGNERPDIPDPTAMAGILDQLGLDIPTMAQKPSARYTKVELAPKKKGRP